MSNSILWKNWFKHSDPLDGILRLLRQVPVFINLNDSELQQIREVMHMRKYTDSEVVFREGEPGTGMYVIIKGVVRVVLHHGQDDEIELVRLEQGDFFGEFSLLDDSPRSATCVVEGSTELGGFFRPDLMDIVERQPQMGNKVLLKLADVVAERLRQTNADLRLTKEELRAAKDKLQQTVEELAVYRSRSVQFSATPGKS